MAILSITHDFVISDPESINDLSLRSMNRIATVPQNRCFLDVN